MGVGSSGRRGTVELIQFWQLRYDPRDFLPSAEDSRAGHGLVAMLRAAEGDVFVPYRGYLSTLAGKRPFAHGSAVEDVLGGRDEQVQGALRREIEQALQQRRFSLVVVDSALVANPACWLVGLEQHYQPQGPGYAKDWVGWAVSGWRTRPALYFRPVGQK